VVCHGAFLRIFEYEYISSCYRKRAVCHEPKAKTFIILVDATHSNLVEFTTFRATYIDGTRTYRYVRYLVTELIRTFVRRTTKT
jgi:hypothetical protein